MTILTAFLPAAKTCKSKAVFSDWSGGQVFPLEQMDRLHGSA